MQSRAQLLTEDLYLNLILNPEIISSIVLKSLLSTVDLKLFFL